MPPGNYTLRIRVPHEAEPVLSIPGLEVRPDRVTHASRGEVLVLPSRVRGSRITISDESGGRIFDAVILVRDEVGANRFSDGSLTCHALDGRGQMSYCVPHTRPVDLLIC